MRKITKGILSIALVAVMLFSIIPFAHATGSTNGVAVNTTTQQVYTDLTQALSNASAGDRITLTADTYASVVTVFNDVELDLNGHTLEAEYVACYGSIADRSESGEGVLKVPEKQILMQKNNAQLPVKSEDGYRFLDVTKFNAMYQEKENKFIFQPFISAAGHELLAKGTAVTGVTIFVRVSWLQKEGTRSQLFVYNDAFVKKFLDSYYQSNNTEKYALAMALTLMSSYQLEELTFQAVVASDAGVEFVSQPVVAGEQDEETVLKEERTVRLLPEVLSDFPEGAMASAPGVVFSTSPYAYIDTNLFAGKHITRIGIPVKSVQALDDHQTFTLSVVKTTSDAYQYVSQHILHLPLEQLGSFTTVNKWVYVDVDLQLADDETLAFGMPNDTVEWGYLSGKVEKYAFRSANGTWKTPNSASIFFDIYATETLEFRETEYGFAAVTKTRAFPNVLKDFPESAIAAGNDVEFTNPPYAYLNQTLFSGSRITKIGIPVKSVQALDNNQTFTLSIVKNGTNPYQFVSQHTLTLPLDQLGSSTTVNKWIYLDVDISLAADETLAFGGKNDTVIWAWKSGFANTAYEFRDAKNGKTKGIFFDIYKETVLTYEEYLQQKQEEQERLEAEQEQARQDALLKEKLSGKGISILGDSISTFQGWSNNTTFNSTIGSNYVYYTGSKDGFAAVSETWWMQAITRSGLELVVNNSWSGDCVTSRGVSRALQLHNNDGKNPDIIAVYLGINDFRTKITVDSFRVKYEEMISGMLEKYDSADVYLFTLLYTTNVNSGVNPGDVVNFNTVIAETAEKYNCTLVDLYNETGITSANLATYMGDGNLHPNYAGMDCITRCFLDALKENYLSAAPTVSAVSYIGESQYNVAAAGSEPVLKLQVTYSDSTTAEVDITEDMYVVDDIYTKPNFQVEGTYNLKVTYQGVSTVFDISVIDSSILIRTEEFIYGSYFDHDRFSGNTGTRITSGSYAAIRSADALLPAQEITIRVNDTNLSDYKVTLGYYTKDGIYTGRTGILPMTNGELTIKASEMAGSYFRVNVYIYNGRFTTVPASAIIVVYGKEAVLPEQPSQPDEPDVPAEGKKISVVGDSISTGGYPSILANMTGATIQNLSASGAKLAGNSAGANTLVNKISGISQDADLIIIFGGTNDYWHKSVEIGAADSTNANTYCGALNYILNYLKTNHPDADYLFVFPPDQTFGGNASSTNFGKGSLDDFRAAFLNFCNTNQVSYVNLGDTEFDSASHSGDGVHPNTKGHQIIAEAIYAAISKLN